MNITLVNPALIRLRVFEPDTGQLYCTCSVCPISVSPPKREVTLVTVLLITFPPETFAAMFRVAVEVNVNVADPASSLK